MITLELTNESLHWKNKPACRQSDETSESISKGEGPSALDKGKGIDLQNWGALSEVSEDLDLDRQRATLASWNLVCNMAHSSVKNSEGESEGTQPIKKNKHEPRKAHVCKASKQDPAKDKHPSSNEWRKDTAERKNLSPVKAMVDKAITLSDKPQKCHHTPKAMEPVEQINPESYIGLAFKHLNKETKMSKRQWRKLKSSEANSDASTTSSDASSDESESSDSLSDLSSVSTSSSRLDSSSTLLASSTSCS